MPFLRPLILPGLAVLALAMLLPASAATPSQPVIALFTDYGMDDPYVSQVKGVILTIAPTARLLDLTHSVTPFSVAEGAFLLEQCAEEFPAGTIFVAVVDPQVGTERDPILVQTTKGKFYIGPDNGLLTRVIDQEGFSKAWKLDKPALYRPGATSHTFHGRDIFGPIAARLASGMDPDKLGTSIKNLYMLPVKEPTFTGGALSVEVLHADRYGNIILNFRDNDPLAAKIKEGNLVKISIGKENYSAPLVSTYADVPKGRMILLYGGSGLLEIAMNQGSAAKEVKVAPGTIIFLKP